MMSGTTHMALRQHGVCRGTLWRSQQDRGQLTSKSSKDKTTASSSSSTSDETKTVEYCVLVGNRLDCYETFACYQKGDFPTYTLHVVGATTASASTAQHAILSVTFSTHATARELAAAAAAAADTSFRLVTDQGTHVLCQAVTPACRDAWMATLHAGLEQTLSAAYFSNTTITYKPPPPHMTLKRSMPRTKKYCFSCGAVDGTGSSTSVDNSSPTAAAAASGARRVSRTSSSNSPKFKTVFTAAAPVSHYGKEGRCDLCQACAIAQGLVSHVQWLQHCLCSSIQERRALEQAVQTVWKTVAPDSPDIFTTTTTTTVTMMSNSNRSPVGSRADAKDQDDGDDNLVVPAGEADATSTESWSHVGSDVECRSTPSPPEEPTSSVRISNMSGSWQTIDTPDTTTTAESSLQPQLQQQQQWIHLPPTASSTKALTAVLQDPQSFGALTRISPFLDALAQEFLSGRIGAADFMEHLADAADAARVSTAASSSSSSPYNNNNQQQQRSRSNSLAELKKQAFRAAGDMGMAMKLLLDLALPNNNNADHAGREAGATTYRQFGFEKTTNSVDMLATVLEFFLDLCEEQGELSTVAFFWPQLCHLHLCMLPARDAGDLARIDLVEDFLLTVACRYSIHLALELIWSHTSDLEESLASGINSTGGGGGGAPVVPCSNSCRKRRFAVLRFVCELESLLFDYEDGWGGGAVSLGKMLSATAHQLDILKRTMAEVQQLRLAAPVRLTRSVRSEKVLRRLNFANPAAAAASSSSPSTPAAAQAEEKLRIARNADYFSGHLNFMRRICDVAEKLRFMDLGVRAAALEEELELLNSSGAMGGDPLNRIREELIRVVRVPSSEGHVFRSKERTPVLLLMELLDESAEVQQDLTEIGRRSRKVSDAHAASKSTRPVDTTPATATTTTTSTTEVPSAPAMQGNDTANPINISPATANDNPSNDVPPSPALTCSTNLLTQLHGAEDQRLPSPRPGLLKKFGSSREVHGLDHPTTPKKDVEDMLTSVMVEQLREMEPSNDLVVPDLMAGVLKQNDKNEDDPDRECESNPVSNVGGTAAESTGERVKDTTVEPNRVAKTRMSTLGGLSTSGDKDTTNKLAPTGDIRREVLNAIMVRGMQGKDIISAGAAEAVQRSLKELERRRATELLLDEESNSNAEQDLQDATYVELESTRQKLASLGLSASTSPKNKEDDELRKQPTEEDEVMEAIRLLLIENRVAQGSLSPSDAAKVLQHVSLVSINTGQKRPNRKGPIDHSEMPTIDAGDVDPRLVGCGPLPPGVLQALTLWKGEMVTNGELLELVKKDIEFVRHSILFDTENVDKLNEDSAFWGRFAFGERWAEKKSRIAATSPQASTPGWDLVGVIVKSNDDLRQEAFIMQLIELCQQAFELAGLELWVSPYRILATGRSTGIIEMVRNAMSFDALKKRPGYGKGGLREHLQRMTEFTADPGGAFKSAQRNFVRSLAAYSLLSYLFLFKDRHNGNILLDTAGHVIHIDFGFVFGIAPGGSFSLEMSTPFKLTEEMLDVMGGLRSPLFSEFVTLFCCGFLALQSYCDTFLTIVEITCRESTFKCFEGQDSAQVVAKLRERFCPNLDKEETVAYALDLIKQATTSYGTRQYDLFQYLSQGIAT